MLLHQGAAPSALPYRYVQYNPENNEIIHSETEDRPPLTEPTTLNEFYGRSWTRKQVKMFEHLPYQDHFNRTDSNLHPSDEIPTIHVISEEDNIYNLHGYYLQDIDIRVNMTYIRADRIKLFTNVRFKIGGRSSRLFTKLGYNLCFPKDQDLEGYRKLKLRAAASDPSYMREKLAYDMLYAAGMPATQASYVRLFINNRAIGLFVLVEKYDDTWLENEFHGGIGNKHGVLYEGKGAAKNRERYADLSYHGDDLAYYAESAYEMKEVDSEKEVSDLGDLVGLAKFIDSQAKMDGDLSNQSLETWHSQLDVYGFLTNMAFEFLHGSWDGYLQNTENYYLYKDPTTSRFVWIPWDLEYVMGSGPVSIPSLLEGNYSHFDGIAHKPLIKTLLNVPHFRQVFEQILRNLVTLLYDKSFPVIDSLEDFLRQDVEWDQAQIRMRDGLSFLPLGPHFVENVLQNSQGHANMPLPLSLDYWVAADYIIRINQHIPFQTAVEGNTTHVSLMGVKEWITQKSNNVKKYLFLEDPE
ncbi:hypothetical protein DFQ28_004996 [Apophysomyces sp. BC1034]|nr:hypothetical protein DFQ30_004932 [Apophysomyces sp. BC1015]KAG0178051.1 hypothetical protein DFQ29_003992 [Apophysomyces sp. BC1021]KAG0188331.1 hypothetical protein DFQ28_004996 [Apophysomyces sp. BC1034]